MGNFFSTQLCLRGVYVMDKKPYTLCSRLGFLNDKPISDLIISFPQDIHKELEEKIAKFHGKEDAILYISCFDANAGVFEVLLTPDDAVISDELNHASIIDGIRLCKAQRLRYKHRDLAGLCRLL